MTGCLDESVTIKRPDVIRSQHVQRFLIPAEDACHASGLLQSGMVTEHMKAHALFCHRLVPTIVLTCFLLSRSPFETQANPAKSTSNREDLPSLFSEKAAWRTMCTASAELAEPEGPEPLCLGDKRKRDGWGIARQTQRVLMSSWL